MISVIVPMYNSEKYIDRCIESLIMQTYTDIEIVLVDDGSKDNTFTVCRKYTETDDRVKYFFQENKGVSGARNTGILKSTGEYIMFVDSDDWMPTEGIELLYDKMQDNVLDMVIGGLSRVKEGENDYYKFEAKILTGQDSVAKEISRCYLSALASSPCGKIYKRNIMEGICFDEKMTLGEDLFFNLNYFNRCNSIEIISDVVYYYADDNSNSLTNSYIRNTFEMMKRIYSYAEKYFDKIEIEYSTKIDRSQSAYKFFVFSIAYLVRSIENACKKKECKEYIRKICTDNDFLYALKQVRGCSTTERVLIRFIHAKRYEMIYLLAKSRAWVRSLKHGRKRR